MQLQMFLENSSVLEKIQSRFRTYLESSLSKVYNDIALSVDANCPVVSVLCSILYSASLFCGVPHGSIFGPILFFFVTCWENYSQAQIIFL